MSLVVIIFSTAILGLLAYFIKRGSVTSRNIYAVLTSIGFLMFPFVIPDTFRLSFIVGFFSLVQSVLQLIALILLFKSDSRTWYKQKKLEK